MEDKSVATSVYFIWTKNEMKYTVNIYLFILRNEYKLELETCNQFIVSVKPYRETVLLSMTVSYDK